MSVRTTADENLDKVRANVKESLKLIHEILLDEVWGSDEYNEAFMEKLRNSYNSLLEVRIKLGT